MDCYSNEQNRENHRVESINEQFCQQSADDNEQNRENHRAEEEHCQQPTKDLPNEQNRGNHRTKSIKEQYYREKIKNAKLEKRLLINQNRMAIIRHRKEIELLRLKLKILEGRKI